MNDTEAPVASCPADITTAGSGSTCDAVVNYTANVSDNCPGATINCAPASGSTFANGTTTVSCTATDAAGNSDSCTFTVTVTGTGQPNITCPADITVNADAGSCDAVVSFNATATGGCGGATPAVTCSPASGSAFPVGTTTVSCTATVGSASDTCSFTVTVIDNEAPALSCPGNITTGNDAGQCGANVSFGITAVDACGMPSVTFSCSPASGSFFAIGTTSVNCTATDASGNTSSCSFSVTVDDSEAPSVTCPADISTGTDPGACDAVITYAVMVNDNCPGASVSCSPASGSTFATGTTAVSCTATDAAGNTSSCGFNVTVADGAAPTINCPMNVLVSNDPGQCGADVSFNVTANDACSATTVTCTPASGSFFAVGTTGVSCVATDASGNQAMCGFNVIVEDTEAPVITCPGDINITCSSGGGGGGTCPLTQGYWKNHASAWLLSSIELGSQTYTQAQALAILNRPVRGDASINLAHQLIAAKLNVANGAPNVVATEIADADTLLASRPGRLPYRVRSSSALGQQMLAIKDVLDAYNNNLLTPGCGSGGGTPPTPGVCTEFLLGDHPDGAAQDPSYCLRLDNLLAGVPGAAGGITTFSCETGGASARLVVNETAGTMTISGTVYGGEDAGSTYGFGEGLYQVDMTWQPINVDALGWTVSLGNGVGSITALSGAAAGFSMDLYDYGMDPSMLFLEDGHRIGDSSWVGRGWITNDPGRSNWAGTQDWIFTAVEDCQGSCTSPVNYTVTATDNCSATVTCTPASGSVFPIGTTTVNCTATDPAGNTDTCSFTVTVTDTGGGGGGPGPEEDDEGSVEEDDEGGAEEDDEGGHGGGAEEDDEGGHGGGGAEEDDEGSSHGGGGEEDDEGCREEDDEGHGSSRGVRGGSRAGMGGRGRR